MPSHHYWSSTSSGLLLIVLLLNIILLMLNTLLMMQIIQHCILYWWETRWSKPPVPLLKHIVPVHQPVHQPVHLLKHRGSALWEVHCNALQHFMTRGHQCKCSNCRWGWFIPQLGKNCPGATLRTYCIPYTQFIYHRIPTYILVPPCARIVYCIPIYIYPVSYTQYIDIPPYTDIYTGVYLRKYCIPFTVYRIPIYIPCTQFIFHRIPIYTVYQYIHCIPIYIPHTQFIFHRIPIYIPHTQYIYHRIPTYIPVPPRRV